MIEILKYLGPLKSGLSWVLKKCGYKFIPYSEYTEEVCEVKFTYPGVSPKCQSERERGGKFHWSKTYSPSWEKYYEIDKNQAIKRYFQCGGAWLWIKRP